MTAFINSLKPSIIMLITFLFLGGVLYPLVVEGISHLFFREQANGSLIRQDGKVVGSRLIGQEFDDPKYFWGRLSATTPPYNGGASSGSNFGPTNQALLDEVSGRIKALKDADPSNNARVPADLVTSSGSGLDPDISPAAAFYQEGRIARLRHLPRTTVHALIVRSVEGPQWGLFGEPRVNVLELNLALDRTSGMATRSR